MFEYLKRGVAAGGLAGAVYGSFVWLVVNPLVTSIERSGQGHGHGGGHAHHAGEHAHAVSEATTAVVSAGGGVLWGVLLGGAFGAAYFLFEPALPGPDGRSRAAALAGAGFLVVSGAPWVALPPAAPGTEHALGISLRLAIYAGMMALGALAAAGAIAAYDRAGAARGRGVGVVAGALPILALAAVGTLVPAGAPAAGSLAASFRWLVAFGQAGLWALVAVGFVGLKGVFDRTPTPAGSPARSD